MPSAQNSPDPESGVSLLVSHFEGVSRALGTQGPLGEVIHLLASGELDASATDAICHKHDVSREPWFRRQLLDLVLGYVAAALENGPLTAEHQANVRALRRCLRMADGEFAELRSSEVAALLGEQLDRILEDGQVDDAEELYQVELQAAFGLSYDQYLALTRAVIERAYAALRMQLGQFGDSPLATRRKLEALEPLYKLATAQRRSLGAMY